MAVYLTSRTQTLVMVYKGLFGVISISTTNLYWQNIYPSWFSTAWVDSLDLFTMLCKQNWVRIMIIIFFSIKCFGMFILHLLIEMDYYLISYCRHIIQVPIHPRFHRGLCKESSKVPDLQAIHKYQKITLISTFSFCLTYSGHQLRYNRSTLCIYLTNL